MKYKQKDKRIFPKSAFDDFMDDAKSKKLYETHEPLFILEYLTAVLTKERDKNLKGRSRKF